MVIINEQLELDKALNQAWDIFKLASPWVVHKITQLQYSKTTWRNMLPFPAGFSNRSNVSAVKPKPENNPGKFD